MSTAAIQLIFNCLIALQFIVIVTHDLVDIPGWTHGRQVAAVVGRRKLWLVTCINALFPLTAVVLAISFWTRSKPALVLDYWVLYCGVTVLSAITMWYVPYFWGMPAEKRDEYDRMYAGTRQVLPARGDNPRPNLLHVCFHVLFAMTLALSVVLWWRKA
jgi:hypothetical protein